MTGWLGSSVVVCSQGQRYTLDSRTGRATFFTWYIWRPTGLEPNAIHLVVSTTIVHLNSTRSIREMIDIAVLMLLELQ